MPALQRRTAGQMSPADSQLLIEHAKDIAQAAEIYGYTLDNSWTYEQAVCPVAPDHVLLSYSSVQPDGAIWKFSAAVPRQGHIVEIFPIARANYLPLVDPWGEHSYAVFNTLLKEENHGAGKMNLDSASHLPWKTWAVCYAALVTGLSPGTQFPFELDSGVTVTFREHSAVEVGFTARDSVSNYSNWLLRFSLKGLLVGAIRDQHAIQFLPGNPVDPTDALSGTQGRVIPDAAPLPTPPPPPK